MRIVLLLLALAVHVHALSLHTIRVRRADVLKGAAAAATFGSLSEVAPAFADDMQEVALLMKETKSGDAALYMPSVKIGAKGAASTSLLLSGPASNTLSSDSVDFMWFADAASGSILTAAGFKPNGKSSKTAADSSTQIITPVLQSRFKKGLTVVPYLHAVKGGTWEGEPVTIN